MTREINILHSTDPTEATFYHNNTQTQDENIKIFTQIVSSKFQNKHVILIDNGKTINTIKLGNVKDEDIFTCTLFIKTKYHPIHLPIYTE